MAGLIYAYSSQTIDARDDLLECFAPQDDEAHQQINDKLAKAYYLYEDEKYTAGIMYMNLMGQSWVDAMADCDTVRDTAIDMATGYVTAFNADDVDA